jgi:hypothetical protein
VTAPAVPSTDARAGSGWRARVWRRWVVANAWAETVGLGVTALVTVLVRPQPEAPVAVVLAAATALVLAGAVEGAVVGVAQRRVLRTPLPALSSRRWIVATIIGAMVAWALGLVPSTLADLGGGAEPEMSATAQCLLWALLGLGAGPVLGLPQWRVLRSHVMGAGWWVLANGLAWAVGMPIIALGAGSVPTDASVSRIAVTAVLACLAAGAAVGAVHGVWLVWLLGRRRRAPAARTP